MPSPTASFELTPPDEAEIAGRMRALLDGGFPYLVAERDGTLAGYAYAGLYRTRPAYRFTLEDSVYVAPDAQRAGIGRVLLEALIAAAEAKGFRQMIAVIGDSAQTSSIALHTAVGFKMVGPQERVQQKWLPVLRPDALSLLKMTRFLHANRRPLRLKTLSYRSATSSAVGSTAC